MGTSHLNVTVRDFNCTPINNCRLLDLAFLYCNGKPLYDYFPIVKQLQDRYGTAGSVTDCTSYPISDQNGNYLEIKVGTYGAIQRYDFTTTCTTPEEIYDLIKDYFTGVKISLKDGHLNIVTDAKGFNATLTISGTCDIVWSPIEQGSGYDISTRIYYSAPRIMIWAPDGKYINDIEMDVPTGCYKIFARVCYNGNEDTNAVMKIIENCGDCYTVDLLLPEVVKCSAGVLQPLGERFVNDYQHIINEVDDKVMVFRVLAYAAGKSREQILFELDEKKADLTKIGRTDAIPRVDAVIAIVEQMPQCC